MDKQNSIWNDAELKYRLTRVALSVLDSTALAEEIVQQAYLRLLEQEDSAIKNTENWLAKVTQNLAIDSARRIMHERKLLQQLQHIDQPDPAEQFNGVHMSDNRLAELVACLLRTSDSHATATVLLHVVFGMSYKDIANISGRTPASCRQLASRALRKCYNALDADEPCDDIAKADQYVYACLHAVSTPLIDSLSVSVPISRRNSTASCFNSFYTYFPSKSGTAKQVLVLTATGVQWALVLNGVVLCLLGGTVHTASETVG